MHVRFSPAFAAGLLLSLAAGSAAAQVPLTPRALGMGGAYLATARGYETLFLNPANLGLSGTPQWSVALPQVSASGTLLGPTFEDVPALLEAMDGGAGGDSILAKIPESGTQAQFDVRAPLVAVQIGRVAFGLGYGSVGDHSMSKDIVELMVNGYEENRTDYAVGNTAGSRLTYWDLAAGYGRSFGGLSLGVTAHYIRGGTAVRSRMFEPRVDIEARDISVDYVTVLSRGGHGYAVDFGAALQPLPGLTLSAAVANAVAKLQWSEDLRVRDFELRQSSFESEDFWSLKTRYEQSEQPLDAGSAPLRVLETAQDLFDEAYFPAEARLGADWNPVSGTHLGVSYQSHLTEGRMGGRWAKTASVGLQQKLLPLVAVRAGYASNLEEGTLISAGLSLGPVQAGVAKLDDGQAEGAPRSGWMATFGLGIATPQTIR